MTIEALPEETGSNRQVMPKSQAPFLDPTLPALVMISKQGKTP